MMKNVAIISYWKCDFEDIRDEHIENEGDASAQYYHINSVESVPKDVQFSAVIICEMSEDIFTASELNKIQGQIKLS